MKTILLTDRITGEVLHITEGMIKHYIKEMMKDIGQCGIELEIIK